MNKAAWLTLDELKAAIEGVYTGISGTTFVSDCIAKQIAKRIAIASKLKAKQEGGKG
jgi:hypothetical protein